MNGLISDRINRAIGEKVFPGCVMGIVRRNGEREIFPHGRLTYDSDSSLVRNDTVYDLASVTKSIPVASLLLDLVDHGAVNLDDPIIKYLPEFGNYTDKGQVLIRHLLTYTLDLSVPSMASLKNKTPDEIIDVIVRAPLKFAPGSTYLYTNSTACITGLIIRNVSGRNVDDLADEKFFKPLGMNNTTFYPDQFPKEIVAPTEFDEWRGRVIQGEVHDESAYVLNNKFILGMAGLFSTAPDILNFLEMLLNGGNLNGRRYFSEGFMEEMQKNQIGEINGYAGLGWELNQSHFMGKNCGKHVLGKTGFTGTVAVCDIGRGIAYTILSNRTFPKRPVDSSAINSVRADIGDIIWSSE